jgi:subtilisin family serine protease
VPGYNFVDNNTDTHDVRDHGTAVAGTAAAIGNEGRGVAGVSWRSRILPLLVTGATTTYYSDIAEAVTYAADRGARVVNMSLGGTSYSSTLQSAVNYAWNRGVVIVAAAGNSSSSSPFYPAALENVLAVAATDQSDLRASFSNYGSWIDVAAPGTGIYTTCIGRYCYGQGTSFASPQVAGLAALMLAANPGLTNAQVVSLLRSRADDLGSPGFDTTYGYGRINVARAVQAAAETAAGDTVAPTVSITSPAGGSSVSGTVTVSAAATDDVGVAQVALYVDGVLKATDTAAPWAFSWSTAGLSGTHSLVARAADAAGNAAQSVAVPVTVATGDATAPTVAITGVVYDGRYLKVTASASDAAGPVVRVDLLVNGAVKASDTAAPWQFKLNVRKWPKGTYTLTARAYDAAGNTAVSAPAAFTK